MQARPWFDKVEQITVAHGTTVKGMGKGPSGEERTGIQIWDNNDASYDLMTMDQVLFETTMRWSTPPPRLGSNSAVRVP